MIQLYAAAARPTPYLDATRSSAAPTARSRAVVGVPMSVFYDNVERGRHLVRFAFCKKDAVLEEAVIRLARLGG